MTLESEESVLSLGGCQLRDDGLGGKRQPVLAYFLWAKCLFCFYERKNRSGYRVGVVWLHHTACDPVLVDPPRSRPRNGSADAWFAHGHGFQKHDAECFTPFNGGEAEEFASGHERPIVMIGEPTWAEYIVVEAQRSDLPENVLTGLSVTADDEPEIRMRLADLESGFHQPVESLIVGKSSGSINKAGLFIPQKGLLGSCDILSVDCRNSIVINAERDDLALASEGLQRFAVGKIRLGGGDDSVRLAQELPFELGVPLVGEVVQGLVVGKNDVRVPIYGHGTRQLHEKRPKTRNIGHVDQKQIRFELSQQAMQGKGKSRRKRGVHDFAITFGPDDSAHGTGGV